MTDHTEGSPPTAGKDCESGDSPPGEFSTQVVDHLKMIQNVIDRLAGNSFALKGWSLTLTAALVAFLARSDGSVLSWWLGFPVIFPIVCFGLLDAYYLMLERHFRELYEVVRFQNDLKPEVRPIPLFSMNPQKVTQCQGNLTSDFPKDYYQGRPLESLVGSLRRPAVWVLHGGLLTCALLAILVVWINALRCDHPTNLEPTIESSTVEAQAPPPSSAAIPAGDQPQAALAPSGTPSSPVDATPNPSSQAPPSTPQAPPSQQTPNSQPPPP